jgi:hypothetical protein
MNWLKRLLAKLAFWKRDKPDVVPPVVPPVTPSDGKLWPAYYAPRWMGHGYPSENADREAAMGAAQAAAMDCIRCRALLVNDETGVHILYMRSPVDNKHKLGAQNWHRRAKAKGITRWQFVIESPAHVAHWKRLLGYCDYDRTTLQLIVPAAMLSQARATWPGFDVFAEGGE